MSDLKEVIAKWRAMMATDTDPTDPAAIELAQIIDAAEAGMRARDAALEEAAKVCDDAASMAPSTEYGGGFTDGVAWAAANIRALRGAA